LVNILLLSTHNTTHEVWSLDLWNGGKHLYHQAITLVVIICYITFYLSNTSFKTLQKHKLWKFISYWNFVQMKWFELTFLKNWIMYIITFIPFESLNSFEQKKVEYHYSIAFQWPFFCKKIIINKWIFIC
jgi:hypothetical protein